MPTHNGTVAAITVTNAERDAVTEISRCPNTNVSDRALRHALERKGLAYWHGSVAHQTWALWPDGLALLSGKDL